MARKKPAKKTVKKATMKTVDSCSSGKEANCNGMLILIILVLTWWKPAQTWSQITITVLAAIILLAGSNCCKK